LIVGLFTELLSTGGVQCAGRHTAAVLAAWAEQRHVASRFLSLNDKQALHRLHVGEQEFSVSGYGRSKLSFLFAALRAARRRPSLILAGHPNLAPAARAMKLLAPGARTAVIAHGIEVWTPLPAFRRRALCQADRVLAPSTDTAGRLAEVQGVDRERIRVLPWSLDPVFAILLAAPSKDSLPAGFPAGRVILTVGRWASDERYKGLDTLILALAALQTSVPRLYFVAVGEGDDRPTLERLAARAGVADRVCFLSGLTPEQIRACYAACEVFALPSAGEGFGLVFLEAMAQGKPVVGGAHGGTPDIIQDSVNGYLVPHGNVDRLAQVLCTLLSNGLLREEMGRRGRDLVLRRHLFEHFATRLNQVLEDLCAS
jgi:phosphatidylinositol alpha-1,6-mannosyltransferase